MPIYEYQCLQCGARSEALQKMADAPLTTCGACGGELKRLISSPAVQFKGSGWYVTDYARRAAGSDKAGSKPEAQADAGGGSKAEGAGAPSGGDGGEGKGDKPAPASGSAPAASAGAAKAD